MEIHKIIIHDIQKERATQHTVQHLSEELIEINDRSTALVESLVDSYKSESILYAVFNNEEGNQFPEKYLGYKDTSRSNDEFIEFTRSVILDLNTQLRTIYQAKGGYFVFTEYTTTNGIPFVGIFLIRDVEGKVLRRTENSYDIRVVDYVDTKNLAMACRINESILDSETSKYLTFTKRNQQNISEYFLNWICIEQSSDNKAYTNSLYELVNSVDLPISDHTGEPILIDDFKTSIYNYLKSGLNRNVNIRSLSGHFYNGDENYLANFASENGIEINTEFRYNAQGLKKFIKVAVNTDGIDLKFSRNALGYKVRVSTENPNTVIIESEALANAIQEEIDSEND